MEDGKCKTLSITIDTVKRMVVVRVEHPCKLPGKDWIIVEFCWILDFSEDGSEINKVVEFADSAQLANFMQQAAGLMSTQ